VLEEFATPGHAPDYIALVEDQLRRLGQSLSEDCRSVAWRKLEGYTNQEIGDDLGWSTRKVERKLAIIRDMWTRLGLDQTDAE
jgi:DNA-directed RNA polymerase specialized sigma24 family protein